MCATLFSEYGFIELALLQAVTVLFWKGLKINVTFKLGPEFML